MSILSSHTILPKTRCPWRWIIACIVISSTANAQTSPREPAKAEKSLPAKTLPERPEPGIQKTEETNDGKPLDGADGRPLELGSFRPRSELRVKATHLTHAKLPVVDAHSHFLYRLRHSRERLAEFVKLMDRNNIAVCVSLDGKLGVPLQEHMDYLWDEHRDRFVIFANIDWMGTGKKDKPETWDCQRTNFPQLVVRQLEDAKKRGVAGLKIFKQLGLGYRNPDGSLIRIDDPRWDPIWSVCGRLGLPVIIHTADPAAFFKKIDRKNERWEELARHPEWSFPADRFPSRDALLQARNRVIKRHPATTFIGAHLANSPEDLTIVSKWLKDYPNLYVEIASRIGELGRQPYTARKFLIEHADRVLFGTDGPWPETRIHLYWRFLETYDEYFPYSEKEFPPQGFWNIYGVGLPDDVLEKIYHKNAAKIIPGVRQRIRDYKKIKEGE